MSVDDPHVPDKNAKVVLPQFVYFRAANAVSQISEDSFPAQTVQVYAASLEVG